MQNLINQARRNRGLASASLNGESVGYSLAANGDDGGRARPVKVSPRLKEAARAHLLDMLQFDYLAPKKKGRPGILTRVRRCGYIRGLDNDEYKLSSSMTAMDDLVVYSGTGTTSGPYDVGVQHDLCRDDADRAQTEVDGRGRAITDVPAAGVDETTRVYNPLGPKRVFDRWFRVAKTRSELLDPAMRNIGIRIEPGAPTSTDASGNDAATVLAILGARKG